MSLNQPNFPASYPLARPLRSPFLLLFLHFSYHKVTDFRWDWTLSDESNDVIRRIADRLSGPLHHCQPSQGSRSVCLKLLGIPSLHHMSLCLRNGKTNWLQMVQRVWQYHTEVRSEGSADSWIAKIDQWDGNKLFILASLHKTLVFYLQAQIRHVLCYSSLYQALLVDLLVELYPHCFCFLSLSSGCSSPGHMLTAHFLWWLPPLCIIMFFLSVVSLWDLPPRF